MPIETGTDAVAGRPAAHEDDLAERYRLAVATSELSGLDSLSLPETLQEAVEHGEVFTRRWVVETILDMAGYNG